MDRALDAELGEVAGQGGTAARHGAELNGSEPVAAATLSFSMSPFNLDHSVVAVAFERADAVLAPEGLVPAASYRALHRRARNRQVSGGEWR